MNQRTEILKQLKLDIIDKKESIENNPHIDSYGRSYATGRRKNSIARVWVKKGTGNIVVNGKLFSQYFRRKASCMMVQQPFEVTNHVNKHDVYCTVKGGGLSGQAGAIRHAISRALSVFDPSLRHLLKENHFLTRDSRIVERKKYGLAKARCSFQFSKR